jgi:hypothetical protein
MPSDWYTTAPPLPTNYIAPCPMLFTHRTSSLTLNAKTIGMTLLLTIYIGMLMKEHLEVRQRPPKS